MTVTAEYIAKRIEELEPGQRISVSRRILEDVGGYHMVGIFGPYWEPADRIMEKVVGSAHSIAVSVDPLTQITFFEKLVDELPEGVRTYVSPDRRHLFERRGNLWIRKSTRGNHGTDAD